MTIVQELSRALLKQRDVVGQVVELLVEACHVAHLFAGVAAHRECAQAPRLAEPAGGGEKLLAEPHDGQCVGLDRERLHRQELLGLVANHRRLEYVLELGGELLDGGVYLV